MKAVRLSSGLTRTALASRIGTDAQTVKRLERGVGSMTIPVAAMSALDLRLSEIGPGATLPDQLRLRRRRKAIPLARVAARAGLSRAAVASVDCGGGSVASLLSALAPAARRRAQERAYWSQSEKYDRDCRFTPST